MEHSGEKRICENGGKDFNCNRNQKVTENIQKNIHTQFESPSVKPKFYSTRTD